MSFLKKKSIPFCAVFGLSLAVVFCLVLLFCEALLMYKGVLPMELCVPVGYVLVGICVLLAAVLTVRGKKSRRRKKRR